jgi:hypothetical protein
MTLTPLPPTYGATRDALHAVACFAIAPARKARTGRIGLRPSGDGFGTPAGEDGPRIVVRGDRLVVGDVERHLTTVRDACSLLGVEPSPDPGVGSDLPPYRPDAPLDVDAAASLALGEWFAFGQRLLESLEPPDGGSVGEPQLWPEHFDLAAVVDGPTGPINVGASPGDAFHPLPYVYAGPHERDSLEDDPFWNAPFGAFVSHDQLRTADDPLAAAQQFVASALRRLAVSPGGSSELAAVHASSAGRSRTPRRPRPRRRDPAEPA